MKLLLDANLSWRLTKGLVDYFETVEHVDYIDLSAPVADIDIWNWAKKNNFTIVTNDSDFLKLLVIKGFPPKIILLKIGNQSTKHIRELLISKKVELESFLLSDEYGLLEVY